MTENLSQNQSTKIRLHFHMVVMQMIIAALKA